MVDVAGSIETEASLEINVAFTGRMDTQDDVDFYRVTLEAGTLYSILMSRFDEPIREFRLELYDAEGQLLLQQPWRDGGIYPYVSASFGVKVLETGTYYVAAVNTDNAAGEWDHHISANIPDEYVGTVNYIGTNGEDLWFGNSGGEVLYGRAGDDAISGMGGSDNMFGGTGNDTLNGATGRDRITGEDGADVLSGGDQDDRLTGGAGNDTLRGDAHNDRLDGGAGDDFLAGGSGRDVFIFGPSSQTGGTWTDRISGFARGTDIIDLSGFDDLSYGGRTAGASSVWYARTGSGVTVSIDSSGDGVADQFIAIAGVTRLSLSDFDL